MRSKLTSLIVAGAAVAVVAAASTSVAEAKGGHGHGFGRGHVMSSHARFIGSPPGWSRGRKIGWRGHGCPPGLWKQGRC